MFELDPLNQAIRADATGFIRACDAGYYRQVRKVAHDIAESGRQIIFLAGPSSSGKTTTAHTIAIELELLGLHSHTISMDDYYKDVNAGTYPTTADGQIDLESPLCLDIELFNTQMETLHNGGEIYLPKFDFTTRRQSHSKARPLQLGKEDFVIVEGIHALNDMFTDRNPHAYTVYVNLHSHVEDHGELVFLRSWTRLMRRLIRDHNYRNTPVEETLQLWGNVRAGEQLYIIPFYEKANSLIDTALGYEIPVLGAELRPFLEALPQDVPQREIIDHILHALPLFAPIDPDLVPASSLLRREFIQ